MLIKINQAAEILLTYGSDVNFADTTGKYPIYRAIELNNIEGVKLLLSLKVNLGDSCYFSKLITLAYSKGFTEIAEILIEAEAALYE